MVGTRQQGAANRGRNLDAFLWKFSVLAHPVSDDCEMRTMRRERTDLPSVASVCVKGTVGTGLREFSRTTPSDVVSEVQNKFCLCPSGILYDLVESQHGFAARRKITCMRIGHQDCGVTRGALPLSP